MSTITIDSRAGYFDACQSKKSDSKKNVTSKALDIFEQCDPIFKEIINIPIGHKYSWDIERQNTWLLNAHGDSLSVYIEREVKNDDDPNQYYVEFRIFTESKRPSGLLFIDYGTRYAGQNKPLTQNHTKIEAESYGDLAHKLSNIFNDILKEHIV